MNKEDYKKIRNQRDFLFRYYNLVGGVIRREKPFEDSMIKWCSQRLGVPWQIAQTIITKYLDNKHNYTS